MTLDLDINFKMLVQTHERYGEKLTTYHLPFFSNGCFIRKTKQIKDSKQEVLHNIIGIILNYLKNLASRTILPIILPFHHQIPDKHLSSFLYPFLILRQKIKKYMDKISNRHHLNLSTMAYLIIFYSRILSRPCINH